MSWAQHSALETFHTSAWYWPGKLQSSNLSYWDLSVSISLVYYITSISNLQRQTTLFIAGNIEECDFVVLKCIMSQAGCCQIFCNTSNQLIFFVRMNKTWIYNAANIEKCWNQVSTFKYFKDYESMSLWVIPWLDGCACTY